jgi:riboflavin kinase/FMN adenylyltransferase
MQLFRDLAAAALPGPTVLSIGAFDGVHRGHRDLIQHLKTVAAEAEAQAAVLAFHPRPKSVFAPELHGNDYLTTADERAELFEALGLDAALIIPFTLEIAKLTAEDFMEMIVDRLNLTGLCVGYDFALGKGRQGNVERLAEIGQNLGYSVTKIKPFLFNGETVSSTRVRDCLLLGDVRGAANLLGRYPSLRSEVIPGARRGRLIGYPTANFAVPSERLLPSHGVYASFVCRAGAKQRYPSVTNVGIRPSFNGTDRTVETHIFDFHEEIYGQTFTLEFVEYLRPEMKFDGIDALVMQISRDAARAQELLVREKLFA